jgi:hypothetical protein
VAGAALALAACRGEPADRSAGGVAFTREAWAGTEGSPIAVTQAVQPGGEESFEDLIGSIETKRVALSSRWDEASGEERDRVRQEARSFVVDAIVEDILPAWHGTPWTMYAVKDGLKPDAKVPGEKGKGVSCSYFIASVLTNAGLRLESRSAFAGAIALHIQRSLAPEKELHRYWSTTPEELGGRMRDLGDGLYLVGLNCHIGFTVVRGESVRFVHSSYLDPWMVVDEDLSDSAAIAASEKSGYVVTSLFADDELVEAWLEGRTVPLEKS